MILASEIGLLKNNSRTSRRTSRRCGRFSRPELIDFGQSSIRNVVGLFVSVMHMRSPDTLYTVENIHRRLVALYETAPKNPDRTPNVEIVDRSGKAQPLDPRDWEERPARTITSGSLHRRFEAKPCELPDV